MDASQDRPRKDDLEPFAQKAVERSRAQAAQLEAPHVVEKPRHPVFVTGPPGEEECDPVVL